MEVKGAQGEKRHENLGQGKDDQGILLQKFAADGATDGKPENKGRKHLVKTVAGTAHQKAEQTYPDNLVNEGGEPRNGRNPEPGILGRHGQFVFGNVIDVQGLGGMVRTFSATFRASISTFLIIFFVGRSGKTDIAENRRQQEVDRSSHAKGGMVTQFRNQQVAGHQNSNGRTQAVGEVEHGERKFLTALAQEPCRNEGEGHAHRNSNGERRARSQHHLGNLGARKAQARNPFTVKEKSRKQVVEWVVNEAANTDGQFHRRIAKQGPFYPFHHLARDKTTNGKAAHVNAEREHLAIAGVAQEKLKVTSPGSFVNQSRKTRKSKEKVNENVHKLHSLHLEGLAVFIYGFPRGKPHHFIYGERKRDALSHGV